MVFFSTLTMGMEGVGVTVMVGVSVIVAVEGGGSGSDGPVCGNSITSPGPSDPPAWRVRAMKVSSDCTVCVAAALMSMLEDGCGILVALGDVRALAGAMQWMIAHRDEAAAMGQRGRCKVQGRYELRNALEAQEAVYREALDWNRK